MTDLISSTEHITRSKACRLVFSQNGRHSFGGAPDLSYSGLPLPAHVHHFLTLDTDDPLTPIRFETVRFVPLIYPLAYSAGGGEIGYRVRPDKSIHIEYLSEYDPKDPPYFELNELPQRKARLKPLSYSERRILGSDIRERSFLDKRRMKRLWNGECFRIAGILEYRPKVGRGCRESKDECDSWVFAYFPASEHPFGDIWHEYSSDVWFCFSICLKCGVVHAFNEST